MKIPSFCAALSFVAGAACTMQHSSPPNELIYGPAVVLAGADQSPKSGFGVYVGDGKIAAVEPFDSLRVQHSRARVVDVSGTTIMPGLTDAHGHLYGMGRSRDTDKHVGA